MCRVYFHQLENNWLPHFKKIKDTSRSLYCRNKIASGLGEAVSDLSQVLSFPFCRSAASVASLWEIKALCLTAKSGCPKVSLKF
jgi:hypothetical protein